ncbi:hypothetical protein KGA66_01980 [Actinocrinis puniceicyclus]|uniref:Uncharacterized protein n=1 Tax=Actinocrinis puniceicyclus TaxID=977794 RepID=A0A8J7WLQ0_9ACTN|nr:hypothetical protein [Actinocrinis puniceicyclus]MBS2961800.1 hypothetical protein [Actinocrinis puniceicyclus]
MNADKGKETKEKPIVKVPKSKIGRAFFFGSQVAGALSAVRSLRAARQKSDRLALVHAVLNAAMLVVTLLVAARTVREAKQVAAAPAAEPLMLPAASGAGK